MRVKMIGRTGYQVGGWPEPRPTGLHCWMARDNCGLTQEQMAYELGVRRATVIFWERQGAALFVPGRLVASQIDFMLSWGKRDRPTGMAPITASYRRVHGDGSSEPA